jgi:CPA1 family monovalent cation:H+ antiporter
LIPFGAYFLADSVGASGILAAVAAGITMGYVEQGGGALAETRVRRSAVWETIQFGASGVIFILLGEQLPRIAGRAAEGAHEAGHAETFWLLFYVAAITFGVAALRFAWVWALVRVALCRAASWRLVAALTVAGVRGTVTLAGVLSLPFVLADGSSFPTRDLAIFLAAGVIISSLSRRPSFCPACCIASTSPPSRARRRRRTARGSRPERRRWRPSPVPRVGSQAARATRIWGRKRQRGPWRPIASASTRSRDPAQRETWRVASRPSSGSWN